MAVMLLLEAAGWIAESEAGRGLINAGNLAGVMMSDCELWRVSTKDEPAACNGNFNTMADSSTIDDDECTVRHG